MWIDSDRNSSTRIAALMLVISTISPQRRTAAERFVMSTRNLVSRAMRWPCISLSIGPGWLNMFDWDRARCRKYKSSLNVEAFEEHRKGDHGCAILH